jgi:hypothetical protein
MSSHCERDLVLAVFILWYRPLRFSTACRASKDRRCWSVVDDNASIALLVIPAPTLSAKEGLQETVLGHLDASAAQVKGLRVDMVPIHGTNIVPLEICSNTWLMSPSGLIRECGRTTLLPRFS